MIDMLMCNCIPFHTCGYYPELRSSNDWHPDTDNILDFVSKHTSIKDVYHVLSPPGHPSCKSNAKEKNFNYKDEWSWDKTLKVQMDYWGINNIDRVRAKFPRIRTIEFVDTFQATDPRPDLHSEEDCLHYCHVGVPDVWAQFVLEYMQAHTNN
ncbi:hypothetical protein SARC_11696 [Sphaeroforma arctica JP610]|uniref:Uncharacterized protein n=1 Tax=Sphaeroforma arctica JP610 TaxID=667725 RepID=A0A0L0FG82_9EUKA|nr:hypothetical protein SARC_11696 [Sphaeroforma arctica JP610]KNC75787.1 hypothetical protein SARC_11696 [Sphaeroforma arctica JP610]|eukprot:XP_014149689.1 hypothetical protein SARC_11696 [Sphaeroforma arctica JP610]